MRWRRYKDKNKNLDPLLDWIPDRVGDDRRRKGADGPTKVAKNLQRYVNEFAGRHNSREQDTVDQMTVIARGVVGKRLRYRELIA